MNTVKKIRENQKGFTLVELIVVVAILGVLAAVAVPNYMNYLYSSRVNTDIATARELINVARTYAMTNGLSDGQIKDMGLEAIASEADMGEVRFASTESGLLKDVFFTNNGPDGFQINFNANFHKVGKYEATYVVHETGELPKATKHA